MKTRRGFLGCLVAIPLAPIMPRPIRPRAEWSNPLDWRFLPWRVVASMRHALAVTILAVLGMSSVALVTALAVVSVTEPDSYIAKITGQLLGVLVVVACVVWAFRIVLANEWRR